MVLGLLSPNHYTEKAPSRLCDQGLCQRYEHAGFTTDTQWENP